MKHPETFFDGKTGKLTGKNTSIIVRKLKDVSGIFENQSALEAMDLEQIAYEVEMHNSVGEIEDGMQFGTSYLYPGKVGDEYFMTKGHFHAIRSRPEYYWCIKGEGVLLLMDESRHSWSEKVTVGSLHYIPGYVAHRLINTGKEVLTVGACWPSDAGHDYDTIANEGFSLKVKDQNGDIALVTTK